MMGKADIKRLAAMHLERLFRNYLFGTDTKKRAYTSRRQKLTTLRSITSFVNRRILDRDLENSSEIWVIVLEITMLDFDNVNAVREIYSRLYKLSGVNSSKYYVEKGRESKTVIIAIFIIFVFV